MDTITVYRIRPITWKVSVRGEDAARYVLNHLRTMRYTCSEPLPEPELYEPPLFSILVKSTPETPVTANELEAILAKDERIELAFENAHTD